MHFRASSPYDYYRPSKCERRVALRHRGVKESPRTEFDDLLARLGGSHETAHLDTLSGVTNLASLDPESQERETLAAIRAGVPAIYQARFRVSLDLDGESGDLVGLPDFLVRDGDGYIIRDSKLARSVGGRHPEIALQLQLYGWLYERVVGKPPTQLQVHSGSGELINVPYDGGKAALEFLRQLRRKRGWVRTASSPFEEMESRAIPGRPVGEVPVLGAVDLPHPAGADGGEDLVRA
jgi:predicted RecB family nuclease